MRTTSSTIGLVELKPGTQVNYPFTADATFTSKTRAFIPPTFMTDARLYPPGRGPVIFISKLVVTYDKVVLTFSDSAGSVGTADVGYTNNTTVPVLDAYGREIGVIIGAFDQIRSIAVPGTTMEFSAEAMPLLASVTVPTPQFALTGVFAANDSVPAVQDVWFVGEDGVKLEPVDTNNDAVMDAIRVHIISEPLFKRKLCSTDGSTYLTHRGLKQIIVNGVTVVPDIYGNVQFVIGNGTDSAGHNVPSWTKENVARIIPIINGLQFKVIGNSGV